MTTSCHRCHKTHFLAFLVPPYGRARHSFCSHTLTQGQLELCLASIIDGGSLSAGTVCLLGTYVIGWWWLVWHLSLRGRCPYTPQPMEDTKCSSLNIKRGPAYCMPDPRAGCEHRQIPSPKTRWIITGSRATGLIQDNNLSLLYGVSAWFGPNFPAWSASHRQTTCIFFKYGLIKKKYIYFYNFIFF